MEKFRRKIKVFWVEHSDPIVFYSLIILAIILIVQGLNTLAIKQNQLKEKSKREKIESKTINLNIKENEKYTSLIENFIDYCKKEKVEKAYELLSENCKRELYHTITDFKTKYIEVMFTKNYDISIQYQDNNIYKIVFKQSILENGSEKNRKAIEQYYKIEIEGLEEKIYINFKNN